LVKNGVPFHKQSGDIFNEISFSYANLQLNQDLRLNAGDKISISVFQNNSGSLAAIAKFRPIEFGWFSGHLVFAE
jgi:protein involved in polysaccharide export with SLBB domain